MRTRAESAIGVGSASMARYFRDENYIDGQACNC
jgi:hypothetical protein